MGDCLIRPATAEDCGAIATIYGDAVLHGTGTFEEICPTPDEMAKRQAAILALGLPYYVAEVDGVVTAYASATAYRPRWGYRFTAENSVYVAPEAKGRGLGRILLTRVLADCERLGVKQMMAVIGGSENEGSIALHRSLGYDLIGVLPAVGWKFGRWLDVVLMQKPLNGGGDSDPFGPGLPLPGG